MTNGIKFADAGNDISRVADYDLHFSSEWPTVHVLTGGTVTKTVADGDIFYEHDLGFTPAFMPYVYNSADSSYEIFRAILAADKRYIYFHSGGVGGGGGGATSQKYGLFIFNIDITKNFTAPKANPTVAAPSADNSGYGVKMTDGIASVRSDDMQDYKMNTDGRAPLIHAVAHGYGTEAGSTGSVKNFSYTHNLPYNPMFIPFVELPTSPGQFVNVANFAGVSTVDSTITIHDLLPTQRASIVVLKDPFDVSNNTTTVVI